MRRAEGWQIALVCGLMLAGQPFGEGCRIAQIGFRRMKASLPPDWTGRKVVRGKWRGERLEALAKDYRALSLSIEAIMDRHKVTLPTLRKLVTTYGWPRRPFNRQAIISTWCPERRRLYNKLRVNLGIAEAKKAAWAANISSAGPQERPIPASTPIGGGRDPTSGPHPASASNSSDA